MRRDKTPITVAGVALRAGVSRTFLYNNPAARTAMRVPHSSLQPGWPEPTAKPRPVEFVLPPHPGHELRFDLLLGAQGGADIVAVATPDQIPCPRAQPVRIILVADRPPDDPADAHHLRFRV